MTVGSRRAMRRWGHVKASVARSRRGFHTATWLSLSAAVGLLLSCGTPASVVTDQGAAVDGGGALPDGTARGENLVRDAAGDAIGRSDAAPPEDARAGTDASRTCSNKTKDALETDVDCGGGVCPACASGKRCGTAKDCLTSICTGGTCFGGLAKLAFSERAPYATGQHPQGLAVADLDGDRKVDLAVVDYKDNRLSVLMGNGNGTLRAAVNYPTEWAPFDIVAGDFNGDGHPDLAVPNQQAQSVGVFLNKGNGALHPAARYESGGELPSAVATGDWDGDGKLDLVVANWWAEKLGLLRGKGNGTFAAPAMTAATPKPVEVLAGDFNGDGKADVGMVHDGIAEHAVGVYLGDGRGGFGVPKKYPVGGAPSLGAVGDLNGDGALDVVVADSSGSSNSVSVLLGKGDGTFAARVPYPAGNYPESVLIADFNKDGKPDLAVGTNWGGPGKDNVFILLGRGDGTFIGKLPVVCGELPTSIATGDFNGDGKPDLVCANINGIAVVLNTSK